MKLSTGIKPVDRILDGGINSGSCVAIVTPPEAQVEPLLCAPIHLRPTQYFTTVQTEEGTRRQFEHIGGEPQLERLEHVGIQDALSQITSDVQDLGTEHDVVIDVIDPLEDTTGMAEYADFLNRLSERLIETESIAFFSCLDSGNEPDNRELTLSMADYVWQLIPERKSESLEYYLEMPKASNTLLDKDDRVFQLDLGRDVRIDQSRDI
jgi:KaiC/GvpD/RAD55 family RecA-like ATPase